MSKLTARLALAAMLVALVTPVLADEPATQPVVKKPSDAPAPRSASPAVVRKRSVPQVQSRVVAQGCSAEQTQTIEEARRVAAIRTQVAVDRIRGLHPTTGSADRHEAEQRAVRLIDPDVNFDQVQDLSEKIRDRVSSASVSVACEAATNPSCAVRTAFVENLQAPIHFCPHFFETSTAEQRIRTLVHESAHLVGIKEEGDSESYCVAFDCDSNCGGFYAADSWAHFLHCTAGEAPDPLDSL